MHGRGLDFSGVAWQGRFLGVSQLVPFQHNWT